MLCEVIYIILHCVIPKTVHILNFSTQGHINTRFNKFKLKVYGLFFFLLEDCFANDNKRIRCVLAILEKK